MWSRFNKTPNVKFHENPFSDSRLVAGGHMEGLQKELLRDAKVS
jgi:hypothetical protein